MSDDATDKAPQDAAAAADANADARGAQKEAAAAAAPLKDPLDPYRGIMLFASLSCVLAVFAALYLEKQRAGGAGAVLGRLDSWFRELDASGAAFVDTKRVALQEQPGAGRGIVALEALAKDQVVASIPLTAMVNVEHAVAEFTRIGHGESELNQLLDIELVAALVLHEQRKGRSSRWSALWQSYPENVTESSLFYCDAKLDALATEATEVADRVREMRSALEDRWHRSAFLKSERVSTELPAFKTAVALVQSRTFSVAIKDREGTWHKSKCLVPFADLVNTCQKRDFNADCRTNEASTHFECFATKPVAKGDFLCSPYADSGRNGPLLANYGFAMDPDPAHPQVEEERAAKRAADQAAAAQC